VWTRSSTCRHFSACAKVLPSPNARPSLPCGGSRRGVRAREASFALPLWLDIRERPARPDSLTRGSLRLVSALLPSTADSITWSRTPLAKTALPVNPKNTYRTGGQRGTRACRTRLCGRRARARVPLGGPPFPRDAPCPWPQVQFCRVHARVSSARPYRLDPRLNGPPAEHLRPRSACSPAGLR